MKSFKELNEMRMKFNPNVLTKEMKSIQKNVQKEMDFVDDSSSKYNYLDHLDSHLSGIITVSEALEREYKK